MPIDYKKYPPNWRSEIVPRILYRAGNCCEKCRTPNGAKMYSVTLKIQDEDGRYKPKAYWSSVMGDALRAARFNRELISEVKVVLTVAHLDHDEENWNVTDDRLMAMCQHCHINNDAQEKYRRQQEGNYGKVLNPIRKQA